MADISRPGTVSVSDTIGLLHDTVFLNGIVQRAARFRPMDDRAGSRNALKRPFKNAPKRPVAPGYVNIVSQGSQVS